MKNIFPAKTLFVCLLIGALVWACIFQACGQRSDLGKLFEGYKFSGQKAAAVGLAVVGGIGTGMNHAYHADARVFEKRWGVSRTSFFGRDAWLRNYHNLDVEQGHKWGPNVHRDVWHFSSAVSTWGKISASVVITAGEKRHWSHYVLDAVIIGAAYGVSSHLTYNYLR